MQLELKPFSLGIFPALSSCWLFLEIADSVVGLSQQSQAVLPAVLPPPAVHRCELCMRGGCCDSSLLSALQAGAEISTVNPEQYSKRFNEFMSNILT